VNLTEEPVHVGRFRMRLEGALDRRFRVGPTEFREM
jgi:hypothetical protein